MHGKPPCRPSSIRIFCGGPKSLKMAVVTKGSFVKHVIRRREQPNCSMATHLVSQRALQP